MSRQVGPEPRPTVPRRHDTVASRGARRPAVAVAPKASPTPRFAPERPGLRLHDTATGTLEPLKLRDEGRVSMYVCGPTVYDVPHLGLGRYALVFDVLRRCLEFSGLEVRYMSNITDIDDK